MCVDVTKHCEAIPSEQSVRDTRQRAEGAVMENHWPFSPIAQCWGTFIWPSEAYLLGTQLQSTRLTHTLSYFLHSRPVASRRGMAATEALGGTGRRSVSGLQPATQHGEWAGDRGYFHPSSGRCREELISILSSKLKRHLMPKCVMENSMQILEKANCSK